MYSALEALYNAPSLPRGFNNKEETNISLSLSPTKYILLVPSKHVKEGLQKHTAAVIFCYFS